jgi:hypothetical protein
MRWNTGRKGAPPPDEALPVRGETNLYSAQLWFMQGGAQSVEVELTGNSGAGTVLLPVNAVATRVLVMSQPLRLLLGGFGSVLVLLLMVIVGAAVRESVLEPGTSPTVRRVWLARGATVLTGVLLAGALYLGKRWWDYEAAQYRNNRLFRPLETLATVHDASGRRVLRLELIDDAFFRGPPLVPDHGRLMHLFLVREPGLDVFGHLHPRKIDWKTFEVELPAWPAGQYTLYGDITFETGLSDTLTAQVTLGPPLTPAGAAAPARLDPDDSWHAGPALAASPAPSASQLMPHPDGGQSQVEWLTPPELVVQRDSMLRFMVRDSAGQPALLEPYLGMAGHLALRRDDGTVFTHLHPGGSFSMAAQELFVMRGQGRAPLRVAGATDDPLCRLPTADEIDARARATPPERLGELAFPYAFPKPGRYRLWLQVKIRGEILTGVFDCEVREGPKV